MKKTEVIQPIAIKSPICFSGDRSVLPNTSDDKASIEKGFPQKTQLPLNQGGVAPERTDFNSLFYLSTDLRFNLQNGCVITFSQEVSDAIGGYPQDAVLSFIDSEGTYKMVKSVIDDNTYNFVSNPNYIDDIHWQEIKMGGGGSHNLFDPVYKDHILTYNEKFGLELLGEYVYKTAIAGTRYGYPDFYNKVLAEYNDPNNTKSVMSTNVNITGSLTNNNGILSGFSASNYATLPNNFNPASNTWEQMWCFTTGSSVTTLQSIIGGVSGFTNPIYRITANGYIEMYCSTNNSSWDIKIIGNSALTINTKYYIKGSFNGTEYKLELSTDGENFTTVGVISSTLNIYIVDKQKLGNNNNGGETFLGSIDLKECYINIDNQRWWNGANIITTNANGHQFYDIADKSAVDTVYNNTGIAWFYGVDTANERIFLPRNDYCFVNQKNHIGNDIGVGNYFEGELPNIKGNINTESWFAEEPAANSPFGRYNVSDGGQYGSGNNPCGLSFNASKSSAIYKDNGQVKPTGVGVYVYMCVGNVKQEEAQGQYIDFTTTENDTTPLFTANIFEFDAGVENPSWLRANGNYVSGLVYPTCYAKLVSLLNYNPLQLKVVDYDNLDPNIDYSEYWIINQTNQTFRTPIAISHLMMSKNIVGNGKALGLYAKLSNNNLGSLPLTYTPSNYVALDMTSDANLNKNAGESPIGGGIDKAGQSQLVGLSTEPQYTNVENYIYTLQELEDAGLYLFFKVANAVENLEIINGAGVLSALNNKLDLTENMIPSNKYDDLTLGASGTTYVAPANGWFFLQKVSISNQSIALTNMTNDLAIEVVGFNGTNCRAFIPVKKGDNVYVNYNTSGATVFFRFIYSTNN